MRIVALADIHGTLRYLNEIISHLKSSDLTIIAGDITNFGDRDDAERVIAPIKEYSKNLIAVYGNCDYPTVEKYLEDVSINISWKWVKIEEYVFIGLAGSLICPARTPSEYPDEKYMNFLDSLLKEPTIMNNHLILVTHEPPKGTKCDKAMGGYHVGSDSIRLFIDKMQPILVITGHIHEGKGIDKIGKSIIVNPGPFRRGDYSVIEIDDSTVKVELKS